MQNRIASSVLRNAGALSWPVGEQRNFNHDDCPLGQDTRGRLYIKRTRDCVLAFCHNCGLHGIIPIGVSKVQAINQLIAEAKEIETKGEVVLPADMVPTIKASEEAKAWLFEYGITTGECNRFGIGYSPSWGRVIIPVFDDKDNCIFWQGRKVDKGMVGPKYISAKTAKKPLFFVGGLTTQTLLFIVEDALSAIKLGRYENCVALLGTSGDIDGLSKLMPYYSKTIIMLDPDFTGRAKAEELHKRLVLISPRLVFNITGTQIYPYAGLEPKQMSDKTLKELVLYANGL